MRLPTERLLFRVRDIEEVANPIFSCPLLDAVVDCTASVLDLVGMHSHRGRNKSGWLVLLTFIPFVGALITIILGLLPGSREDNVYGRSPRLASGNESTSQPVNRFDKNLADTASGF